MTIGYVFDDGGRKAAGFKGTAGDCVTRAVAILTGTDYRQVYNDAAALNLESRGTRSARNGITHKDRDKLCRDYGLVRIKIPKGPKPTYSQAYEMVGDCIVKTRRHICAIVDGQLRDTFDGRTYYWPTNDYYEADFIDENDQAYELRERKAMSIYVRKESK